MLAEYEELKRQEQRRQQLRDELVSLLEGGAEIEPGPLSVEIREQERRTLSFANLCAIGGEPWAQDIVRRIDPIRCRALILLSAEQDRRNNRWQTARRRQITHDAALDPLFDDFDVG